MIWFALGALFSTLIYGVGYLASLPGYKKKMKEFDEELERMRQEPQKLVSTGTPVKISFARLVGKEYYNQRNAEALENDLANDIGRNLLRNNYVWFNVYDEGIDDNYKIEASLIVYKQDGREVKDGE